MTLVTQAHSVKGTGAGRGVKTANFNCLQFLEVQTNIQSSREGSRGLWKVFHGCRTFWEKEFGWGHARSLNEWQFLWARAPKDQKCETTDRVSGEKIEWMVVDLEWYVDKSSGTDRRKDIVLSGHSVPKHPHHSPAYGIRSRS